MADRDGVGNGGRDIVGRGLLGALLLLGGCAKRTWEIGPKAHSTPPPPGPGSGKAPKPRRRGPGKEGPSQAGSRAPAARGAGGRTAKIPQRTCPGGRKPCPRREREEAWRAAFLLSLPPYPWPSWPPPGWKEREEPWDPVAWFGALRERLRSLPREWILRREARLTRRVRALDVPKGAAFPGWKALPPLPPLRGGKDYPRGKGIPRRGKAVLAGFLLRGEEGGPCFLVPCLYPLRRGRLPGPGERVLLRFPKEEARRGEPLPPPFAALLVEGELQVEPAWSVDTLEAGYLLEVRRIRVLP